MIEAAVEPSDAGDVAAPPLDAADVPAPAAYRPRHAPEAPKPPPAESKPRKPKKPEPEILFDPSQPPDNLRVDDLRRTNPTLEDCPKDLEGAWTWLINVWCPYKAWLPDQLRAHVFRMVGAEQTHIDPVIDGNFVLGDPSAGISAGDAIRNHVIDWHHRDPGTPAYYYVMFKYSGTGEIIKRTESFRLDSWASIDARRKAYANAARASGAGRGGDVAYPDRIVRTTYGGAGVGASGNGAPGMGSSASSDAALHQRLGYLEAVAEEAAHARAEGRAPREVSAPGVVSVDKPLSRDDVGKMIAESVAQALPAVLAAAGIRPKTEAEKLADLMAQSEARHAAATAAAVKEALVAAGVLNADGTAKAALPSATAAGQTVEHVGDAIDTMVSNMEKLEASKKRVRKALGLPEEDEKAIVPSQIIVEPSEKPEKKWYEQLAEGVKAVQPVIPGILSGLAAVTEGSTAGQFFGKMAGAVEAASKAATAARSGGGWKPPGA